VDRHGIELQAAELGLDGLDVLPGLSVGFQDSGQGLLEDGLFQVREVGAHLLARRLTLAAHQAFKQGEGQVEVDVDEALDLGIEAEHHDRGGIRKRIQVGVVASGDDGQKLHLELGLQQRSQLSDHGFREAYEDLFQELGLVGREFLVPAKLVRRSCVAALGRRQSHDLVVVSGVVAQSCLPGTGMRSKTAGAAPSGVPSHAIIAPDFTHFHRSPSRQDSWLAAFAGARLKTRRGWRGALQPRRIRTGPVN